MKLFTYRSYIIIKGLIYRERTKIVTVRIIQGYGGDVSDGDTRFIDNSDAKIL